MPGILASEVNSKKRLIHDEHMHNHDINVESGSAYLLSLIVITLQHALRVRRIRTGKHRLPEEVSLTEQQVKRQIAHTSMN